MLKQIWFCASPLFFLNERLNLLSFEAFSVMGISTIRIHCISKYSQGLGTAKTKGNWRLFFFFLFLFSVFLVPQQRLRCLVYFSVLCVFFCQLLPGERMVTHLATYTARLCHKALLQSYLLSLVKGALTLC